MSGPGQVVRRWRRIDGGRTGKDLRRGPELAVVRLNGAYAAVEAEKQQGARRAFAGETRRQPHLVVHLGLLHLEVGVLLDVRDEATADLERVDEVPFYSDQNVVLLIDPGSSSDIADHVLGAVPGLGPGVGHGVEL